METIAGIFRTRGEAETAIQKIHALGIPNDRMALLTPNADERSIEESVEVSDTEQPGMGKAMGGAVGGAMGAAGGATLGAAAASLLVPGVGLVLAGGILGAAILGAGGAAAGVAVGEALEENLASGIPHDELYIYEDALAQGRSVVIAFVEDPDKEEAVRKVIANSGAESVDAARENWWVGLRDAEQAEYDAAGRNFARDEVNYRRGFEAALTARGKDLTVGPVCTDADAADEVFCNGYARGQRYHKTIQEQRR